jgi:Zn-dependent peptidase ImmA (M78 family)
MREAGSGCLYHRKRKTVPARLLRELDATMRVRNYNVSRLLNGLEIEPDRAFYTLDLDEYGGSPEAAARSLRRAWRLPRGPIPNLTALVESAGGIIYATDFQSRKLFGMSCWATMRSPFFFLNSSAPAAVLRWTIAHELAHLTIHATAASGDLEAQADQFAGEFLAPRDEVTPDLRGLSMARLPALKMFWRISMKALITRARNLGAIDPTSASRLFKQYSARRYNDAEPYPVPSEPPTIIDAAVQIHLGEHGYAPHELAEVVRLSEWEFRRELLRSDAGNVVQLVKS